MALMYATLNFSEALVRSAVAAFWWRTVGWKMLVALLVLSAYLGYAIFRGDRSWFVGMLMAVLVLGLGFLAMLYFVHLRSSLARFHRMGSKQATLEADAERFVLSSDVGTSELKWTVVSEVWRFEKFWLLFLSRAQFITLPLADLDQAAQGFIVERVESNAGKVA